MLKSFRKFIPFAKVAEQSDGSLFVYGLVTAEKPDQEDEVCDYDSTKPFYQKLVSRYSKATSAVDGMEQSIAPLREMHQLKAVGCGKSIDFDDSAKTIHMGFKVVETEAVRKVKAGVLIGFSQGGDYIKTWKKGTNTWYTSDPGEVSLVDSPCLEDALISQLIDKSYEYVKESGSMELRKFQVKAKETESLHGRDGSVAFDALQKKLEEIHAAIAAQGASKMDRKELEKKLAEVEKGAVSFTKAELDAAIADGVAKANKTVADHLGNLHKMVTDAHGEMTKALDEHKADAHECIGKCMKVLGTSETGAGEVKGGGEKAGSVTMTKAELEAEIAKGVEAAKKAAETKPVTFTKEEAEKLIADGIEKAMKEKADKANDPTSRVKLMLVGRDGKTIEKSETVAAVPEQELSKSAGF